jgi:nucleoside-diphosphate-sugar epimerase
VLNKTLNPNKRVIVFGGTGGLGRGCCQWLLQNGFDVAVFSRQIENKLIGSRLFTGDISDYPSVLAALTAWRPYYVLQLAASLQHETEENPTTGIHINVTGATNVLEAAAQTSVKRFVYGSSVAVYGDRKDLMSEEDTPTESTTLYGLQKHLGERLGKRYSERGDFSFAALRYSGILHPAEPSGKGMALARYLIMQTAYGNNVELNFVSGNETCQLTYVEDAVIATMQALFAPRLNHLVYNVSGPAENYVSLSGFYKLIRDHVPSAGYPAFGGQAVSLGMVNLNRARLDLNYRPQVDLTSALVKMGVIKPEHLGS